MRRLEILFTGFDKQTKSKLIHRARQRGHHVPWNVTKGLDFLVCGPNAGKMKLKRSMERGAKIVHGTRSLNKILNTEESADGLF